MSKSKDKTDLNGTGDEDSPAEVPNLNIQDALTLGLQHHNSGNLSQAEDLYRKILETAPGHPDANHLLGMIERQAGRNEQAVEWYSRAIQANPDVAAYHGNLGNAFKDLGRLDEAVASYLKALAIEPDFAEAHSNLGSALKELGRLDEAVASYRKALTIKPDLAGAHNNLGNALKDLGKLDEAVASYRKALAIQPDYAEAHSNLGNALQDLGALDEAMASYRKALAIQPDYAEAHGNLGNALQELERLDEAVASYRKALAIQPDFVEAHSNLGNALQDLGALDEAVASYRKALAIQPDFAEAHSNLGLALQDLGALDEAVASYHKALAIKPDFVKAHTNLGGTLKEMGQLDEALACHRRAVEIDPDSTDAHYHLSLHLLLLGEMKEGWDEYEWRWRTKYGVLPRDFPQAPWQGEDPGGKTVLVWCEQGIGDEILYAGMIPALTDAGARVILECDPRMVDVFARSFPGVTCIARGAASSPRPVDARLVEPGIDYQSAAGSLGRWLRPNTDPRPGPAAYLAADGAGRDALRERYKADGGGLLVGVAWNSKNKRVGDKKSLPLLNLGPLAGIPGVQLVDLQYGDTRAERKAFAADTGAEILHDDSIDQMADLDAFAAQVSAMDLVVTVSNTTAHFAGALGVPTWVMLNSTPLSCWLLDRDDSPWYPSVTLFRQAVGGEWADVIKHIVNRLRDFQS